MIVPKAAVLLLSLLPSTLSQTTNSTHPKRGLVYIQTDHPNDYNTFTRPNSPLTWYYNYSPWPSLTSWSSQFAPMVHGASDAAASVDTIKSILNGDAGVSIANSDSEPGNRITHVLTFNEPDGDTNSGGSDSSPWNAAQVYLDTIAPLRQDPWNLKVGLPATTGSPRGIQWLRDFNTSCHSLNKGAGCEFDFVATHWYGDFGGLASWLGQIHELYPDYKVWLTEFAVPGLDDDETQAFMNQSLPYLDGLGFVERYGWFGTFRSNDANEWTGNGVSLLDGDGRLNELGAEYLGGQQDGFDAGVGSGARGVRASIALVVVSVTIGLLWDMW